MANAGQGSISYLSAKTKTTLDKSKASRVRRTEAHKANILDVVNRLSEQELEKVSEMLKESED